MRRFALIRWMRHFFLHLLLCCCAPAALAQGISQNLSTKPGVAVTVATAKCIFEPVKNSGTSLTKAADGTMQLSFTPDPLLRQNAVIYLETGDAVEADGQHCSNAVAKRYVVNLQEPQEVPTETIGTAFRVLVAALVIATLLESAFELLFNWRLFQAFFVGKPWRTPIMFGISLLVAREFDIDVLGPLFDAYRGRPAGSSGGGWLTSILTAMILAGGSVGVNRIMTRFGIRSPFPKAEEERAMLAVTEAYVSVTVTGKSGGGPYSVNMSEDVYSAAVPAMLGVIGPARPGLQSLLFPAKWRVPRSGGIRVSVTKSYRFSVTDLQANTLYDMSGTQITSQAQASLVQFAPRAFIDLVIVIK